MSASWAQRRLHASLGGAVAFILVTALALLLVIRDRDLREARAADRREVASFLESQGRARVDVMDAVLLAVRRDRDVEGALRSGDPERLLELTAPLFDTLRQRQQITQLYFITPDRRVLLRVHQPDRSGDLLASELVAAAERTQSVVAGLEMGPLRGVPRLPGGGAVARP